jgi:hypothetical protein
MDDWIIAEQCFFGAVFSSKAIIKISKEYSAIKSSFLVG